MAVWCCRQHHFPPGTIKILSYLISYLMLHGRGMKTPLLSIHTYYYVHIASASHLLLVKFKLFFKVGRKVRNGLLLPCNMKVHIQLDIV